MILKTLTGLLFILGLTLFAISATPASLDKAIQAWLADDDKTALPALAALAADGDIDAQVLLGVIATRPHSPYVANLSRKERNRLLRAPGGLSGKSWLKVAAEAKDARAAALIAVEAPPFRVAAIASLLELDEEGAAATALVRAAPYRLALDSIELQSLVVPEDISYALRRVMLSNGLGLPALTYEPHNPESYAKVLLQAFATNAFLSRSPDNWPQRDQQLRLFPGDFRATDAEPAGALLQTLAESSRPAQRLLEYCKAACAEHVQVCVGDTVALVGGYDQIWRLGPPINTFISEDQYLASPRLHADIAQQITARMQGWSQSRQANWSTKSCAAASRFRTYFP